MAAAGAAQLFLLFSCSAVLILSVSSSAAMANNLPWISLLGLAVGGMLAKNESLLKLMVSILQWLLFDGCGEVDFQVQRCVWLRLERLTKPCGR